MQKSHKLLRYACYTANGSMSIIATLSPLLFLTFRSLYGISYSLLGLLVLINFTTQLLVDLILSFYSHKFNLNKLIKLMPALTVSGLLIYAAFPYVFPNHVYLGLVLGTILFSASGGLAEVLISPIIAALPSDNPERDMSALHSIYAWGVVCVVIISSGFLLLFGSENWQLLALLWLIVPLFSYILFLEAEIPQLKTPEKAASVLSLIKNRGFILYFVAIFFGGASECTMAQWSSSYLEMALNIPKIQGDIFGVALFAVMLGLGRTLYSKFGKNIYIVLILGSGAAAVCYITAALTNSSVVGLFACALTGLFTSLLWPGSLVVAADKFPAAGVAVFALMAAGGDLGGAAGPQIVGAVTDAAIKNNHVIALAQTLNITAEQAAMKLGLLSASVFPILAVTIYIIIYKGYKKQKQS